MTRGLAATSTLQIQADANLTRGRLLHHFPSRAELLFASVDYLVQKRFKEVRLLAAGAPTNGRVDVRKAVETIWTFHGGDQFWAYMELWMGARADAELASVFDVQERGLGSAVRVLWDELLGPEVASRAGYLDVRETLITSMRGVAITYALHKEDWAKEPDIELWVRIAQNFVNSTEPKTKVKRAPRPTRSVTKKSPSRASRTRQS